MSDHPSNKSSDAPIESSEDDTLKRGPFAKNLARFIQNRTRVESTVIALYGDWGSGKTSLKNLILKELDKQNQNKVKCMEFNPWECLSREQLMGELFETIAMGLDENATEAKTDWFNYSKKLALGLTAAGWIAKGVGLFVPGMGLLEEPLKEAGAKTKEIVAQGEGANNGSGKAPTLDQSREKLKKSLKDSQKSQILIVIDDIDRLTASEISLLLQLVKANCDLPRLAFLLLSQRSIIEAALMQIAPKCGKTYGRDFLEKIVTHPFDIPPITEDQRRKLLEGEMRRLFGELSCSHKKKERFANVWSSSLRHYLTTLRNIHRIVAVLEFQAPLLSRKQQSNGADNTKPFEVDADEVELLQLAILQVFESSVYQAFAWNLDGIQVALKSKFLLKSGSGASQDPPSRHGFINKSADVNAGDQIGMIDKQLERAAKPSHARTIVQELFPFWQEEGCHTGDWLNRKAGQRVSHPQFLASYFTLTFDKNRLSRADCELIRRVHSSAPSNDRRNQWNNFMKDKSLDDFNEIWDVAEGVLEENGAAPNNYVDLVAEVLKRAEQLTVDQSNAGKIENLVVVTCGFSRMYFRNQNLEDGNQVINRGKALCSLVRDATEHAPFMVAKLLEDAEIQRREKNLGIPDLDYCEIRAGSLAQARAIWLMKTDVTQKNVNVFRESWKLRIKNWTAEGSERADFVESITKLLKEAESNDHVDVIGNVLGWAIAETCVNSLKSNEAVDIPELKAWFEERIKQVRPNQ